MAVFCLFALQSLGQITVSFPQNRAVFQRDNTNKSVVYISGYYDKCVDRVEARFVPRSPSQGVAEPVGGGGTAVQSNPQNGLFYGSMTVKGGWYRLEVRGIRGSSVIGVDSVARVGVGEVFVVAGQSNATGGDSNPNGPGAADDRVNSVNFQNISPINPYSDIKLPCPQYVHLDALTKTAPFGNYAWCWGAFGDSLVKKINVPVMIFNTGWSGSGVRNWSETTSLTATTISRFGYTFPEGLPFGHLKIALNNYVSQLGIRAILWHQGESENTDDLDDASARTSYRNYLRNVIENSRSTCGKGQLAWLVSRASRFTVNGVSRTYQPVIDAQNDVIGNNGTDPALKLPNVFEGPATDDYWLQPYRHDEIHFSGYGLLFLADLWVNKLTETFFTTSNPYPGTPPVQVSAIVAGESLLSLGGSAGWSSYQWLKENDCATVQSTSQQWSAQNGIYVLQVKDSNSNVVFSPMVRVPVFSIPSAADSSLSVQTSDSDVTLFDITHKFSSGGASEITDIYYPTFPVNARRFVVNGVTYGVGGITWPTSGVRVPSAGLSVQIDPDKAQTSTVVSYTTVNQFCMQSSPASVTLELTSVPLAVSLLQFEGENREGKTNLYWTTTQEVESSYFEIERSCDAKEWLSVGKVDAQGASNFQINYNFEDEHPSRGTNYYRLKMVDRDGSFAFSRLVTLKYEKDVVQIYPNPTSDRAYLEISADACTEFQIRNVYGQLVWSERYIPREKGEKAIGFSLDTKDWKDGVYIVNVSQDGARPETRKLVVNH